VDTGKIPKQGVLCMKANYNKPIFDHTHNPMDHHIVEQQIDITTRETRLFCLKCAGYCSIVPDHILPNWLRKAKNQGVQFRFANSDIPEM